MGRKESVCWYCALFCRWHWQAVLTFSLSGAAGLSSEQIVDLLLASTNGPGEDTTGIHTNFLQSILASVPTVRRIAGKAT